MKPHFFALCAFALFFAAPPARADKPRSDITTHLTWRASVSIDADDDLLRWNVKAESAKLSLVTAPEGKRPGYRFESESVLESGGRYLDANIALKIMWKGRVYELLTGAHFALQKTAAFQLGTTPDGLAVWLHLTPEVAWLAPEAPAKPAPMPSPGAHHGTAVFIAPLGATPAVPDIGAIMAFPACPNPIADVLPGKMYDVRQYLSSAGIKLSDDDFAWFHLKGDLLIVRASRKNLALVGRMVDTWQSALPRNALIDAGANIGDGRAAWQIRTKDEAFTKDDWTAVSSASGGPGIGHRCRITGKLSDDNRSFRYKA
ncbi:MAG TPA: hypothetical protein VG733_07390, partial [Chthoniobacteraceae bacterium]|nr:hypothetical protein [Chthoniobacteraceae bacterium]